MNTDNRERKWITAGITAALVGTAVLLKDDGLVKNVALALADTMLPQAHAGYTKSGFAKVTFIKFPDEKRAITTTSNIAAPTAGTEMKTKN